MFGLLRYLLVTLALWSLVPFTNGQSFQRTIVMIYADSSFGESLFLRGGISHENRPGCVDDAELSPCAIPIQHRIVPADTQSQYSAWSAGDNYLDWYGPEVGQGTYQGELAGGTPLMFTEDSNNGQVVEDDGFGFTPLNRFGDSYWMMDVDMDCSATENGWFELKGFAYPWDLWEADISQHSKCAGVPDIPLPYTSTNHHGRCGMMNVFFWTEGECNVYEIPSNPSLPPPVGCGQRKIFDIPALSNSAPRIVNGDPSVMGYWPWHGVLQYDQTIGGCGAVLIDSNWALTAGHCVRGTNPAILSVRFGEQNLYVDQNNEQAIPVIDIISHPRYENPLPGDVNGDFDIAMLPLQWSVDLTSYVVNPACLPYGYATDAFVGMSDCWATGFGGTLGTGEGFRLNEINVPVWTHADCLAEYGSLDISVRQVCMGTDTKSPCGGDSGGPLICNTPSNEWVLVGLTSWGADGCQGGPAVYTRITEMLDWIDSVRGL